MQPGEVLLVHGAGGGSGLTAIEVGKAMGAIVIASAGGADKLAAAAKPAPTTPPRACVRRGAVKEEAAELGKKASEF